MKKLVVKLVLLGVVFSLHSPIWAGSEKRVGTNAGAQLLIPVGARDVAMGGSAVSYSSGIEALYWNPAGLVRSENNADLMVSRMDYIAGIGVNYLAIGGNFSGFGALAFSLKSLSFGDIPVTTEDAPDGTGGMFSPTFMTVGMTYARQLTDRVFVGASLNLINEEIERVKGTGVAMNIGVQYQDFVNIPGLNMGVVIKDVGTQMKYDGPGLMRITSVEGVLRYTKLEAASFDLPSTMELGISYTFSLPTNSVLHLNGVFQNNNYASDEYRLGGEYAFNNLAFVRMGYVSADETSGEYLYGMSYGGGVKLNLAGLDLTVDYAFRDVEVFAANHIFSLKFGF